MAMQVKRQKAQHALLDGYVPLREFARAYDIHIVTAMRWHQKFGLPVVKIGTHRYVHVERARAWMAARERAEPARRAVG